MGKRLNVFINGTGIYCRDLIRYAYGRNGNINVVGVNGTDGKFSPGQFAELLGSDPDMGDPFEFKAGSDKHPVTPIKEIVTYHGGRESIGSVTIREKYNDAYGSRNAAIPLFRQADYQKIPYEDLDVDVIYDASGSPPQMESSQRHLDAGAPLVQFCEYIDSPFIGERGKVSDVPEKRIKTHIMGVNDNKADLGRDRAYSCGSSITNCIAVLLHALNLRYSVDKLLVSDYAPGNAQSDVQGSWVRVLHNAAGQETGLDVLEAILTQEQVRAKPEMVGKLVNPYIEGWNPLVSAIELGVGMDSNPSVEEFNRFLKAVAEGSAGEQYARLKGRLGCGDWLDSPHEWVGNTFSALVDDKRTIAHADSKSISFLAFFNPVRMPTLRQAEFMEERVLPHKESLKGGDSARFDYH